MFELLLLAFILYDDILILQRGIKQLKLRGQTQYINPQHGMSVTLKKKKKKEEISKSIGDDGMEQPSSPITILLQVWP